MFKRNFKEHGPIKLSTFLIPYRIGDIVDIKANAAQQKGMPHKFYHGRTGIVYNVTQHAVGVIVNKVVGNPYSTLKCRQEFLDRVSRNHDAHVEAKAKGERVNLKRVPVLPRGAHTVSVSGNVPQTIVPVPYETTI
ncbi:ribosomal protein L21e-domain-containing protein [Lactarius quietus]|nr:ribosomal protein L21e-domain-containing protein [Lactarius quietus]